MESLILGGRGPESSAHNPYVARQETDSLTLRKARRRKFFASRFRRQRKRRLEDSGRLRMGLGEVRSCGPAQHHFWPASIPPHLDGGVRLGGDLRHEFPFEHGPVGQRHIAPALVE